MQTAKTSGKCPDDFKKLAAITTRCTNDNYEEFDEKEKEMKQNFENFKDNDDNMDKMINTPFDTIDAIDTIDAMVNNLPAAWDLIEAADKMQVTNEPSDNASKMAKTDNMIILRNKTINDANKTFDETRNKMAKMNNDTTDKMKNDILPMINAAEASIDKNDEMSAYKAYHDNDGVNDKDNDIDIENDDNGNDCTVTMVDKAEEVLTDNTKNTKDICYANATVTTNVEEAKHGNKD